MRYRAIKIIYSKNQFASNNILCKTMKNKISCGVPNESTKFITHNDAPMRVRKSLSDISSMMSTHLMWCDKDTMT